MIKKILFIDDQEFNRIFFERAYRRHVCGLTSDEKDKKDSLCLASSIAEAKEFLKQNKDLILVLIDLYIDAEHGVDLAKYLDEHYPNLEYKYCSSCNRQDIDGAERTKNIGKEFNKEFFVKLKEDYNL